MWIEIIIFLYELLKMSKYVQKFVFNYEEMINMNKSTSDN